MNPFKARLEALGLVLPPAPAAVGNYVPCTISGGLLYVSGQLARRADGTIMTGRLGADLGIDDGVEAARLSGLGILAQAEAALGDLGRIVQVLKLTGYVTATPEFAEHPKVLNGASELMVAVLADKGRHARAVAGVASLPAGAAVEVDAIIAIS